MVDLGEDGGEVVDPVEGEGGEDCVECVWFVGDCFCRVEDFSCDLDIIVEWEV